MEVTIRFIPRDLLEDYTYKVINIKYVSQRASLVAHTVRILLQYTGDWGSILGVGKILWRRAGVFSSILAWEILERGLSGVTKSHT